MNNNTKKHSDINPLMTELKKLSKTKEKNTTREYNSSRLIEIITRSNKYVVYIEA